MLKMFKNPSLTFKDAANLAKTKLKPPDEPQIEKRSILKKRNESSSRAEPLNLPGAKLSKRERNIEEKEKEGKERNLWPYMNLKRFVGNDKSSIRD